MLGLGGPFDMGGQQKAYLPENKSGFVMFDAEFECGNIDQVR